MIYAKTMALWAAVIGIGVAGCSDAGTDLTPPLNSFDVATVEVIASPVLPLGAEGQLQVVLRDAGGNVIVGPAITYSSDDPDIVSVTQSGRVRGIAPGETDVTAEAAGKKGKGRIRVPTATAPRAASVHVTPASAVTAAGSTVQFGAEVRDSAGAAMPNAAVTWSSANTAVASVDNLGVVTGVAAGTAQIRATSNGVTGTADVVVETSSPPPPPPPSAPGNVSDLAVTGSTASELTVRFTQVDDGAGAPARYQVRFGPTPSTNWGAMTPVATGTCAGVVNGTAIGAPLTCTVGGLSAGTQYDVQLVPYRGSMADGTAVFGNVSNRASGSTSAAPAPTIASVTVSPTSASVAVGGTTTLSATARDGSGNVVSGVSFQWSSSATGTATVNQNGVVTGVAAGSATITASAGGQTGQASVSVTAPSSPTIATVTVSPSSASVQAGSTTNLTATARDGSGNVISGVTFQWSSSATSIATVSQSGTVSGVAAGSATITATAGGRTGQATVTVTAPPPPPPPSNWRPNQPSNFSTITEHDWSTLTGNGWGYSHRGGQFGYIHAVNDATFGRAAEFVYLQGFPNGNDPGVLIHYGVRNRSAIYLAFRVRFSDNWHWQDPGMKFVHIMMGTSNVHLDAIHPSPAWREQYGTSAGQWILSPTAWSTPFPTAPHTFNNLNTAAAQVKRGEWQVVELMMVRNTAGQANGVIRLWVDGVATAHHSNVQFPSGAFDNVGFAGTYGGGRFNVPHDMFFRMSDTFISVQ